MAQLNFGEDDPLATDPSLPDNRHGSRQLALQALYWAAAADDQPAMAVDQLALEAKLSPPTHNFATDLVNLVIEHEAPLRQLIIQTAKNWSEKRISRIDSIILRLALVELLFRDDIPVRVSIHEAVELAKTYSGEKSYSFINGILDTIVQQKGLTV